MERQVWETWERATQAIWPLFALDAYFPVLAGAREAAAITTPALGVGELPEDYGQACRAFEEESIYAEVKGLEGKVRVGYALQPTLGSGTLYGRFYFSQEADPGKVRAAFRQATQDIRQGRRSEAYLEGIRLDGELLGLPECCVETFVASERTAMEQMADQGALGKGTSGPEVQAILQEPQTRPRRQLEALLGMPSGRVGENTARSRDLPEDVVSSYFTMDLFPCAPGCARAATHGKEIRAGLERYDAVTGMMYRNLLLHMNAYFLWTREHAAHAAVNSAIAENVLQSRPW
ncbi:MAG: hypothetical protein HY369_00960 [Candidatus Aenigmarchaeota archaeon]|nr:hypothetical protein [Candidatus Aenigmarchaeota archaeon]